MSSSMPRLLVVGVGGLGTCVVSEALERGLAVSVVVRDEAALVQRISAATVDLLDTVIVGEGTNPDVLDTAMADVDVVVSGRGADLTLSRQLAAAVHRNQPTKLCWPGGTTNVLAEDGHTPNYKTLGHLGSWVNDAYAGHQACIDAIRDTGINYVIFCPGRMASTGYRSNDVRATVRINRDAGPFVSYEDAAWVIVEAAVTDTYDRQLVSAATLGPTPSE